MEETSNYVQVDDVGGTAGANITFYTTITVEVKCPYSDRCIDFKKCCDSCKHNERRSFYEPDYPYRDTYPWYPYLPNYPLFPNPYITWYTTTTHCCDNGDDLTTPTTSCYAAT